ncbi:MAG: DNA gyrase/topoisomerase IV subunit A, partial [Muribaculaceae bacterium]|nr:DNA gyrase/topoisomerase IV subunit A [Muribaculaceae bacterium]
AKKQRFIGENPASRLIALSDAPGARVRITFCGGDEFREPMEVMAAEFIAVKSYKAKGKRLTTWQLDEVTELEPVELEDPEAENGGEELAPDSADGEEAVADALAGPAGSEGDDDVSDEEVRDEINGQQHLF